MIKNLLLILAITTMLYSCKNVEKTELKSDNTEAIKIVQDTLATSTSYDILGTWSPLAISNSDWDNIEIDSTSLHINYPMGVAVLKYDVQGNEMILTYDYSDTKIPLDCDDCYLKKVGKLYINKEGYLVVEIKTNGLKCGVINDGKIIFRRGNPNYEIDQVKKKPDTKVDFDIFSIIISGFESEIDETAKNSPKNTISLKDNSDGWGLFGKKIQIASPDKSLKFDLNYCTTEQLRFQDNGSIAWKGNSSYDSVSRIGNSEFLFIEFDEAYYTKCEKELKQKLQLKDTLVEIDYEISKLSYKGKPVLLEPKFILLKITATNSSGAKVIRFLKVEVYEGGC